MASKKTEEEPRNSVVWLILLFGSVIVNIILGGTLIVYMIMQSSGVSGSTRFESGVNTMQEVCGDPLQRQKLYFGQNQYDATGRKMTRALIDYECDWVSSDSSSTFTDGYNNYLKAHDLPPASDLSKHLLKK